MEEQKIISVSKIDRPSIFEYQSNFNIDNLQKRYEEYDKLADGLRSELEELNKPLYDFTFVEKAGMAWFVLKKSPALITVLYKFYKLKEDYKVSNDLKTTILGFIQGLIVILGVFGVNIAPELQTQILSLVGSIFAIITAVKGYFTNKPDKQVELP